MNVQYTTGTARSYWRALCMGLLLCSSVAYGMEKAQEKEAGVTAPLIAENAPKEAVAANADASTTQDSTQPGQVKGVPYGWWGTAGLYTGIVTLAGLGGALVAWGVGKFSSSKPSDAVEKVGTLDTENRDFATHYAEAIEASKGNGTFAATFNGLTVAEQADPFVVCKRAMVIEESSKVLLSKWHTILKEYISVYAYQEVAKVLTVEQLDVLSKMNVSGDNVLPAEDVSKLTTDQQGRLGTISTQVSSLRKQLAELEARMPADVKAGKFDATEVAHNGGTQV
jgi:hypothetical protein